MEYNLLKLDNDNNANSCYDYSLEIEDCPKELEHWFKENRIAHTKVRNGPSVVYLESAQVSLFYLRWYENGF